MVGTGLQAGAVGAQGGPWVGGRHTRQHPAPRRTGRPAAWRMWPSPGALLQTNTNYSQEKHRCEYLHSKLAHIKRLIAEYDQRQLQAWP